MISWVLLVFVTTISATLAEHEFTGVIPPACEVTPQIRTHKRCIFREFNQSEVAFKYTASEGCYLYTPIFGFNPNQTAMRRQCTYHSGDIDYVVRCLVIPPGGSKCYPIYPDSPEVVKEVERTMASRHFVEKWINCSIASMDCCQNEMNDENTLYRPDRCPMTWDGWKCWPPAESGSVAEGICPEFAYTSSGPDCNYYAQKTCEQNGMWEQMTNYRPCGLAPRLLKRIDTHIIFLACTIAFCFPAFLVLSLYKKLRVRRLALHRNLLIAIIVRSVLVIITKSVVLRDELATSSDDSLLNSTTTIMERNGGWCKFLAIIERTAASTVFACMLVDGIFMHRRIVSVFKRDLNIYIVNGIAAAITLIPIIVWAIMMAIHNDANCWIVYTHPGIHWVLDGPRILLLIINTALLIHILWVLLTKMNRKESTQQLSTARATIFLMPLFGVQFFVTMYRPNSDDIECVWMDAYFTLTYFLESLQGIMVSIFYCYANKEVHMLIKSTYKKTEDVVSTHINKSMANRRATKADLRRATLSTMATNSVGIHPDTIDKSTALHNAGFVGDLPIENELRQNIEKPSEYVDDFDNKILESK